MSRLDVRDLANEKLPAGRFPGDVRADFRLHIATKVHRGITEHAKQDVSVEICGVLVGNWETDPHGPYAVVTDHIRCESAASKFAEVTFTHESWAQINKEMDTRFADKRIVGWYHSHPDFGIFLSERDCFIHEHFFSGAGQVAYVIDPVRELEGVFAWRNGKPEPLPHFWIGDAIRSVDASRPHAHAKAAEHTGGGQAGGAAGGGGRTAEPSYLGTLTTVLAWLCLFLLGYLWAGVQSSWNRQMVTEGMVANFVEFKLLHEGMEANLATVRQRLAAINDELKKLPEINDEMLADKAQEVAARRKELIGFLDSCGDALQAVEDKYGFSEEERSALARLIARKLAALRQPRPDANSEPAKDAKPAAGDKEAAAAGDAPPAKPAPNRPAAPGSPVEKQPAKQTEPEEK
ncbi:MAG: Mov34/MPN/PAD-1 family protein [Pirellulales bacterium]